MGGGLVHISPNVPRWPALTLCNGLSIRKPTTQRRYTSGGVRTATAWRECLRPAIVHEPSEVRQRGPINTLCSNATALVQSMGGWQATFPTIRYEMK